MGNRKRLPGACAVMPPQPKCNYCGETYKTLKNHPEFTELVSYPLCPCGNTPEYYKIRKNTTCNHCEEFRYDSKGRKIRTLEDAIRVAHEIHVDVEAGTYSKKKYHQPKTVTIYDTFSEFLHKYIYPRISKLHLTHDDKIWIEDWIEPFLCDVGVFVVSEMHLKDLISTFKMKGEEKERAERLFYSLTQQIKF